MKFFVEHFGTAASAPVPTGDLFQVLPSYLDASRYFKFTEIKWILT